MLSNLINPHDFVVLAEKVRHEGLDKVFAKLGRGNLTRVKKSWEHTESPATNWWDIPAVITRCNRLITGSASCDPSSYVCTKYLKDKRQLHALSLGCGTGHRELRWAETGCFTRIDAFDISVERIEYARKRSSEHSYGHILRYQIANVHEVEASDESYDVILAEGILHHLSPLAGILSRIRRFLKPDGFFVINDFVGPSRFQWTERQLEIVNGLLSLLPHEYRKRWKTGSVKRKVYRPGRLAMMLNDPSEAAESSKILPLVSEIFEIVEFREYGGTVLHLLFNRIAYNFVSEDDRTRRFLDLCFEVEDALLASNQIDSDFVFLVCRKKRM